MLVAVSLFSSCLFLLFQSSDGSYDILDKTIQCLKLEKIEATNTTSEGVECCQELPYNFRGYEVNDTLLSLVGSLVFGFTVGSSVVTSPIIAKLGFRKTGLIGVVFAIIALLLTTWSTSFYFWIFTYSISFGVANNLLYNTGMQMCNKVGLKFPPAININNFSYFRPITIPLLQSLPASASL